MYIWQSLGTGKDVYLKESLFQQQTAPAIYVRGAHSRMDIIAFTLNRFRLDIFSRTHPDSAFSQIAAIEGHYAQMRGHLTAGAGLISQLLSGITISAGNQPHSDQTAQDSRRFKKIAGLQICRQSFEQVILTAADQTWTRDPLDRILVAQAGIGEAPLISKDDSILSHYPKTVWS